MYGEGIYGGGVTDPVSSTIASVLAAGLIYILFLVVLTILFWFIFYRVTKAAVRNGVVEAVNKTGGFGSGGGSFVSGYPPAQDYEVPAAPAYRGPAG